MKVIARKKPAVFTVHKWDGDFNALITTFPDLDLRRSNGALWVNAHSTSEERSSGKPPRFDRQVFETDRLVQNAKGEIFIVTGADFASKYEEIVS